MQLLACSSESELIYVKRVLGPRLEEFCRPGIG